MTDHLESSDPVSRQDRADRRADRSDKRMDRSDARADDADTSYKSESASVARLLSSIEQSLKDMDAKIDKSRKELREERERDTSRVRKLRVVAILALLASAMSSFSNYSNCGVANENRDTIRAIIKKANDISNRTAPLLTAEENKRRLKSQRELGEFVEKNTERVNCANPLSYIRSRPHR